MKNERNRCALCALLCAVGAALNTDSAVADPCLFPSDYASTLKHACQIGDQDIGTGAVVTTTMSPPPGISFVVEETRAVAYATGLYTATCDPIPNCDDGWASWSFGSEGHSATLFSAGTASVHAFGGDRNQASADCPRCGRAYAEAYATADCYSNWINLAQGTGVLHRMQACRSCSPPADYLVGGAGASAGVAKATCRFHISTSWNTSPSITINRSADTWGTRLRTRGIVISLKNLATGTVSTTAYQVRSSPSITVASAGLTPNDPDDNGIIDSWTASPALSGSAGTSYELTTTTTDGSDLGFDVNGDGRFNTGDVAALAALIGTSNRDVIASWDFSRNDAIDASDVDTLTDALIVLGGAGVFGDFNGNGFFTCADGNGASAAFGTDITSANYKATMDWDQDGVINATDKAKFNQAYWAMLPDLNYDGSVTTADLTLLFTTYGQSVTPWTDGDLNGDGAVGTADLTLLLAKFGQSCP